MSVSAILKIRNSLSEWYDIEETYLYAILPVFLLVLWVHIAHMKALPHTNMADKYYFRDIISLRRAVANFNIAETPILLRFQYCLDESIS